MIQCPIGYDGRIVQENKHIHNKGETLFFSFKYGKILLKK